MNAMLAETYRGSFPCRKTAHKLSGSTTVEPAVSRVLAGATNLSRTTSDTSFLISFHADTYVVLFVFQFINQTYEILFYL